MVHGINGTRQDEHGAIVAHLNCEPTISDVLAALAWSSMTRPKGCSSQPTWRRDRELSTET